jgi:Fe-S cluster assembly protein SufD
MSGYRLAPTEALDRRFAEFAATRESHEPALLARTRRAAYEAFAARGLPSTREESWRFTDTGAINHTEFVAAPPNPNGAIGASLPGLVYPHSHRIVVVNGRLDRGLSEAADLPPGVSVDSLLAARSAETLDILGQGIPLEESPFAALNTAFFEDAVVVRIEQGVDARRPLHVVHLTTSSESQSVAYPRLIVVAEGGSRVRVT